MKTISKTLFSICALFFTMALSSNAQLKVTSNGNVGIGLSSTTYPSSLLSINCAGSSLHSLVVIGSNVTTTIPEGPVILENGSEVDIHGITNVYIKNDFTVKQGATLNITTGN